MAFIRENSFIQPEALIADEKIQREEDLEEMKLESVEIIDGEQGSLVQPRNNSRIGKAN